MARGVWPIAVLLAPVLAGCVGTGGSGDEAADAALGGKSDDALNATEAWPALEDALIRPGVPLFDGGCTANFIFSSLNNSTLYIGTAAHCLEGFELNDSIELAWGAVKAKLVYCSYGTIKNQDNCSYYSLPDDPPPDLGWNDFALLELPEEARHLVHPALLHWGGPTRLAEPPPVGTHILTIGASLFRDGPLLLSPKDLDPQEGYVSPVSSVAGPPDEWQTPFVFVGLGLPGDSGSPVITAEGGAYGIVKGYSESVNLIRALDYMTDHTGLEVELKTARMLNEGSLPDT